MGVSTKLCKAAKVIPSCEDSGLRVKVVKYRSSYPEVFCKKGVLGLQENTCGRVSFFNEVAGLRPATLLKRDSGTGLFL